MRRIITSLTLLIAAGCADDMPNPKAWTVDETAEPPGTVVSPAEVEIERTGEFPERFDSLLRPLFPPHGVTTPDNTPRFAWTPGSGDATLLICRNRWCNEPARRIQMRDGAGSTTLQEPLAPGLYWWAVERNGQQSFSRSLVVSVAAENREATSHWGMRSDFDADGFADVATVPTDGMGLVGVAYGRDGELRRPSIWEGGTIDSTYWVGAAVAAVDYDGTGIDWLAVGQPDTGAVTVSPDYVRGRFDVASEVGFGEVLASVGDVNGDGFGDVAVASRQGEAIFVVFGGYGREDSMVQAMYSRSKLGQAISGPADFDEDGFSDFVVGTWDGVYLAFGGPEGVREFRYLPAPPEAGEGFGGSLAVGDVNGDGRADFVAGELGGCATLFYAQGEDFGVHRNCATGETVPSMMTRVALVDHDDDGLDELVTAYEEPFSRCGLRSVALLWPRIDGDGVRVFERDLPGAQLLTPGDVNGDGVADLAIVQGIDIELMRAD